MSNEMIVLILITVLLCAAVLLRIMQVRRQHREYVRRIRSSDLYGHLYPLLLRCNRRCVESITLRPESVAIRLFRPAGRCLLYTFEKHNFDPLGQEALYALAQAVAVDLPLLRDGRLYSFRTHADENDGGQKSLWYEYMIRTDYKDRMERAHYTEKKS